MDQLGTTYMKFTAGFIGFVVALGFAEQMGLSKPMVGYVFIGVIIGMYALIGMTSRTAKISEYYLANRSLSPVFIGMATASDWMSAASFIGMAGTLFALGYDGLAYVMGWTGGYVLLAVFVAPYLRKFGQYTIPDFLGSRYGGNLVRFLGIFAALISSFTYLVAQMAGVGIIMSRFLGLDLQMAVYIGLAGVLVCSMLGGMRAVTWTQVAQYLILIIAFLVPATVMSYRAIGVPFSEIMYGKVLQSVLAREKGINADPKEQQVMALWKGEIKKIDADILGLPASLNQRRNELNAEIEALHADAPVAERDRIKKKLTSFPSTPAEALNQWRTDRAVAVEKANPIKPYIQPFARMDKLNMLALTFCLMVGTAGLPHILMRFYTVPSMREARSSVAWALFFISILYLTAPAYAVLARNEVLQNVIGLPFSHLPQWMDNWSKLGLLSFRDINGDGILQFHELTINADAIVLATPEIAGLPYVISGLVGAGGLAASISVADGLLLTISNSLSHDLYYRTVNPKASIRKRLMVSRFLLVLVALVSAYVATLNLMTIVELVAWAFSIAAASFFPALVMGIWDKRANKAGALAGMWVGLGVCLFYMIGNRFYGLDWWGVKSISAGFFGIPLGFITIYAISRLTAPPSQDIQNFVERVRIPKSAP